MLIAATLASAQTYNTPVTTVEGATYVRYTGSVDMTTDSTGSHYTQAMSIADANSGSGAVQLRLPNVTGTEDVNVFVEFSYDLLNWSAISTAVTDGLSTTVVYDSLHSVGGADLFEFESSVWMRLHFDGQSGNPSNTLYWNVYLPKNTGAPTSGVGSAVNRRS